MEQHKNGVPVYTNDDIEVRVASTDHGFTVQLRSRGSDDVVFFLFALMCGMRDERVRFGSSGVTLVLYLERTHRPQSYQWRHHSGGVAVVDLKTHIEKELGKLIAQGTRVTYSMNVVEILTQQSWQDYGLELVFSANPPNNPS